jgi:hypothetical protein
MNTENEAKDRPGGFLAKSSRRALIGSFILVVLAACDRQRPPAEESGKGSSDVRNQAILTEPGPAIPCIPLLIGIEDYPGVNRLSNPWNDAVLVSKALENVHVKADPMKDLTLSRFRRALLDFRKQLASQPKAVGFFYFAGHGVSIGGQNWLLPKGFSMPGNPKELVNLAIPLNEVLSCTGEELGGLVICLDCCRNDPWEGAESLKSGISIHGPTKIIYAARPGCKAQDGADGNSLFAKHLSRLIPLPDLNVDQLSAELKREVKAASGGTQEPWDEGGQINFSFVPGERLLSSVAGSSESLSVSPSRSLGHQIVAGRFLSDAELIKGSGYSNLRNYERKALIALVQEKLGVAVKGTNDALTQQELARYQRNAGLSITNQLDRATIESMKLSGLSSEDLKKANQRTGVGRKP